MDLTQLQFEVAGEEDFPYLYRLCEQTMRAYVEADLGDCFEPVARSTLQRLLQRRAFRLIRCGDALLGVVAHEPHETHVQLEELYIEPSWQRQGVGAAVMRRVLAEAGALGLPVRLKVLRSNPALAFYLRLGFTITDTRPAVTFMECAADGMLK